MAARRQSVSAPLDIDLGEICLAPPIEPMLAKAADAVPEGEHWLFEPKWDGFRALVFKNGDKVFVQSRDCRPLDRYFPELHSVWLSQLPEMCVLDGEIVIERNGALDFESLQLRLHPAKSRVDKLAKEIPASYVAFDLLALAGRDLRAERQDVRRANLEQILADSRAPLYITPMTRDPGVAREWLARFEGAGLDGVMAKADIQAYEAGKRAMVKIKHARTADCVVAGFRWHKEGEGVIGSLLLGLYDDEGVLHHVGVTSSFTMQRRRELALELEPYRVGAEDHPWRQWAEAMGAHGPEGANPNGARMPGGQSRWSAGKDLSFELLRLERCCEVRYDHLQGTRFRHATTFQRWRYDKSPSECRYDQLEVTPAFELRDVFATSD